MTTFLLLLIILCVVLTVYAYGLKSYYRENECSREVHTISTDDGWHISLYRYYDPNRHGEPVLLCHGLSANRFSLLYPRGSSLTDHLVNKGYDCWIVDLRGSRSSQPPQGVSRYSSEFDDYLRYDLPAALNHILDTTQSSQLHWVGHSMGGMLLYAYELMHGREGIASATTIGSPPGFEGVRMRHHPLILNLMLWAPFIAEIGLRMSSPLISSLKLSLSYAPINWKNMPEGIRFYNIMELPPPRVINALNDWSVTDTWWVDENRVDVLTGLKALNTPLFVIGGNLDKVAPPVNMEYFHKWLPTPDKRILILSRENGTKEDYNHVDLIFSPNAGTEVFEPISEWIAEHANRDVLKEPDEVQLEALKMSRVAIETLESTPESAAPVENSLRSVMPVDESIQDEQWSRALEDAASVLTGLTATKSKANPTVKPKQKSVRKQKSAKKKTVKTAKKPPSKAKAKKKASTKKKATSVSKSKVKKPVKKKASPKKKASAKKKSAPKKKATEKGK
nr:lipolytic enzyme [uncultured bacterium]